MRQAVAYCVPRQDIVDKLIKPLDPNAKLLQNRMFDPFQAAYKDTSGGQYDKVDIAKAKSTLEAAGYTLNGNVYEKGGQKVEFKLMHKDNARRSSEAQLIQASCAPGRHLRHRRRAIRSGRPVSAPASSTPSSSPGRATRCCRRR